MNEKLATGVVAAALVLSACNDEGERQYWQIHRAGGPGAPVIFKHGEVNEFWLESVSQGGRVVYYKVGFDAGKMTDDWKGVILYPRGNKPYDGWSPQPQLDPWNPTATGSAMTQQTSAYANAITTVFAARPINTSHVRLEGDIMVNGTAEALTLVMVKGAIKNNTDLLIVDLKDTRPGMPMQNGSGSGDPR